MSVERVAELVAVAESAYLASTDGAAADPDLGVHRWVEVLAGLMAMSRAGDVRGMRDTLQAIDEQIDPAAHRHLTMLLVQEFTRISDVGRA
jgi:hypothetical protein